MLSDNTTTCVTHNQFVTEGTNFTLYNASTEEPPNVATTTVHAYVTSTEPESIFISTSQGTGSVMVTTAATYCSDCTCQQGM